ncbi:MAG: hypothetical protein ACKVPZ_01380 [Burkholderiaceae bacterium]
MNSLPRGEWLRLLSALRVGVRVGRIKEVGDQVPGSLGTNV